MIFLRLLSQLPFRADGRLNSNITVEPPYLQSSDLCLLTVCMFGAVIRFAVHCHYIIGDY